MADVAEVAAAPPPVDATAFAAGIGLALTAVCGIPVVATLCDVPDDAPMAAFVRHDGLSVAIGVPQPLAAAVLNYRCGGAFVPGHTSGGAIRPIVTEVEAALLRAADQVWPGTSDWTAAPADRAATSFTLLLQAENHDFTLVVAVRLPVVTKVDAYGGMNRLAWTGKLRAALDATPFGVRAVLHDQMIPLAEALAMRVGDIVPIETRREVSLRLGDHALARGMITPDDDGGHRVAIVSVGPAGVIPALIQEQP